MHQQMRGALCLAIVAATLNGCTTIRVSTTYDPSTDFTSLRTYSWFSGPHVGTTPLDTRVREAVDAELAARGYGMAAEGDADFVVNHLARVHGRIDVKEIRAYYGGGQWRQETYVDEYDEGTLVLDVLEPTSAKVLWRGTAAALLDPERSLGDRDEAMRETVKRVLDGFPPKG